MTKIPTENDTAAQLEQRLSSLKIEHANALEAVDKAKALLRERKPFVWNATHLSAQMRTKTLDLLYAYHASVQLVYLERPRAELLSRNHRRDTSLSNKALECMLFKWEVPYLTEAHQVSYLTDV